MSVKTATGQTLSALTPAEDKAQRQVAWKRHLRRVFDAFDVSLSSLALALGYARSKLSRQLDPLEGDEHFRLCDVEALPPEVRRQVIEPLVDGLGYELSPLPVACPDIGCDITKAARAHREASDAVSLLLAAMSDGHVDAAEASKVRFQIRAAKYALDVVDREMAAAEDSRVIPVRFGNAKG
jgi:hypothetical protein